MSSASVESADSGLACLVLLLRFLGIPADIEQLRHRSGGASYGVGEMLRCAKELGLKARVVRKDWSQLEKAALPAIAEYKDGSFSILAKTAEGKALVHDSVSGRPQLLTKDEFEAAWTGGLVVMTRRASLGELARKFDIGWFLQAMHKYRGILTEVFVASFFLQIYALITPLFFQVVIDKVLVHRGLTTLDVLIFGLLAVSIFESLLSALRTHIFAHTTNRIDVELGARLYRHLMALPVA